MAIIRLVLADRLEYRVTEVVVRELEETVMMKIGIIVPIESVADTAPDTLVFQVCPQRIRPHSARQLLPTFASSL